MNISLIWEHLFLVVAAGALSILIGLPLGIFAYLSKNAGIVILRVVDILQTIPALALLGMIMVFVGAGKTTVIIGITLYSLLPIVRNTCIGLEQVDAGVKEAAKGMGMGRLYCLFRVEIPLAFPTIFTGIRIAVVNAIGTAVFAAFVGGGGLGSILNRGIRLQDMRLILTGTGALMLIAIVLDVLMGLFEERTKKSHGSLKNIAVGTAVLLTALVVLLPLGLKKPTADHTLMMYDGNYSETQLMHHMLKMLIEDKTNLNVTIQDQMSHVNNFKALIGDDHGCDIMLSYDGSVLTTFLHMDTVDVPEGETIYDFVNEKGMEEFDVRLLGKIGFDNTYAIAVPADLAAQYGLETVSDLIPVAEDLVFGAEHEFFTEEGSMKYGPFTKFYGLKFKDSVSVDVSLKYSAIENKNFDVTEVYATDGLNRKAQLKVLEDDLSFFPDYNGCFLVRGDTFERFAAVAPNLPDVIALLDGKIRNEDMVEMTYEVDVMGKTVDEVAQAYLVKLGLLE